MLLILFAKNEAIHADVSVRSIRVDYPSLFSDFFVAKLAMDLI